MFDSSKNCEQPTTSEQEFAEKISHRAALSKIIFKKILKYNY